MMIISYGGIFFKYYIKYGGKTGKSIQFTRSSFKTCKKSCQKM
ncbi:hypothetical protein CLOSTASPAR_04707 [[Clostridium] asparagiforme DSM 15981]|uniref:Uncharacterized protein n=1 Tax=[Clostridium] asparagiforme DSM 15981 TaxID=518636 RepID=C0D611_9FIRM|nr:hypothetical protein CLOSTASPAR_04707 [[Clostridium] asparagiforme DSM 15981]